MPRTLRLLGACALLFTGCDRLARLMGDEGTPAEQHRAHVVQARQAESAGNEELAVREYEKARAAEANDPEVAAALGRLYAKRGDDASAVMSLKHAIELSPDPESRKILADIYLRQGQPELAARVLQQVASATDDVDAQVKLVRTLILTDKSDAALELANRLASAHPGSAGALSAQAEALLATGNPDRAAELLDAAVKSAPQDVDVRLARARFLSKRGMHDKAFAELQKGEAAQSERSDVLFARVHELTLLGKFEDAAKLLEVFTASHPTDPEAQSTLAWVKLKAGDTDGARVAAEAVLARRRNDPTALYVRAQTLQAMNENLRAIGAYRQVLDVEPGNADALRQLWKLYEQEGQVTDALSALETLYNTSDANDAERLELARLYSETGFNSRRGLKILDGLGRGVGDPTTLATIRKKLQTNASREHSGGGPGGGGGVTIMRGR